MRKPTRRFEDRRFANYKRKRNETFAKISVCPCIFSIPQNSANAAMLNILVLCFLRHIHVTLQKWLEYPTYRKKMPPKVWYQTTHVIPMALEVNAKQTFKKNGKQRFQLEWCSFITAIISSGWFAAEWHIQTWIWEIQTKLCLLWSTCVSGNLSVWADSARLTSGRLSLHPGKVGLDDLPKRAQKSSVSCFYKRLAACCREKRTMIQPN